MKTVQMTEMYNDGNTFVTFVSDDVVNDFVNYINNMEELYSDYYNVGSINKWCVVENTYNYNYTILDKVLFNKIVNTYGNDVENMAEIIEMLFVNNTTFVVE